MKSEMDFAQIQMDYMKSEMGIPFYMMECLTVPSGSQT